MNRLRFLAPALFLGLSLFAAKANAVMYVEAGTSYGTLSNGSLFFGQSAAQASTSGFLGSLSFYAPITSEKHFFHFELGLQNRIFSGSEGSNPIAMGTSEIGLRLQISRFYVGGGYAPLTYVSKPGEGFTSLHVNSGTRAYFGEAGAIWRVIPEFQIVATYTMERGMPSGGGGASPTISEYGLRFRFPIHPSENAHGSGVDFDGFRYPFGVMK